MNRTVEERIQLGDWAKDLSANPNFTGICNGMVADAMVQLMATSPGSDEAKLIHMKLLAANEFKNALTALANDATMAREEIKNRGR